MKLFYNQTVIKLNLIKFAITINKCLNLIKMIIVSYVTIINAWILINFQWFIHQWNSFDEFTNEFINNYRLL